MPNGKVCDYGCESGRSVVCQGAQWSAHMNVGGCPISTRRAKRDIEYLTPEAVNTLAATVRATRLATYEYTDPALAGRRRLGFILEDQPGSYASNPEGNQVDLYGYTSLLLAAVQSQSRQIDALTQEVETLRQRLGGTRPVATHVHRQP